MVRGFDVFQEHFRSYEDCYTIIGGTACDILMTEAALDFRATKDIDMILLIENRFEEFGQVFWDFIRQGQYKCGWKSSEEPHFYRFTEPQPGFPFMIELFSRRPDFQMEHMDIHLLVLRTNHQKSGPRGVHLSDRFVHLQNHRLIC